MTSHIKAEITYNYPITVTKESKHHSPQVVFKSEGTPCTYIGEHKVQINESFCGDQVIAVRETPAQQE